jgi:cell division protease FtsH
MDGKPPVRDDGAELAPKSAGVPSAGKAIRKRPDAEPGAAPEPQPGG